MQSGLLSSLTVVELSGGIASSACGKLLSDHGATVIKVEPPQGDPLRHVGPFPADREGVETSGIFLHLNTGKKSITLDIEKSEDQDALRRLIANADILVEAFAPGHLASLGLGWDDLRQLRPSLVMASITPFGQTGPYAQYQANELTLYAISGSMFSLGVPDREPLKLGLTVAQMQVGNMAATAVLGAAFGAMRTGVGQQIDLAAMEATAGSIDRGGTALLGWEYSRRLTNRRTFRQGTLLMPQGNYPCLDGYVNFFIFMPSWWPRFCRMLDRPDLIEHPQYSTMEGLYNVEAYGEEIEALLYEFLFTHTRAEIQEKGQAVGIAVLAVNTVEDLFTDPHLEAREYWQTVDHPVAGSLRYAGPPARFSKAGWSLERAPLLGEHNADILARVDAAGNA